MRYLILKLCYWECGTVKVVIVETPAKDSCCLSLQLRQMKCELARPPVRHAARLRCPCRRVGIRGCCVWRPGVLVPGSLTESKIQP